MEVAVVSLHMSEELLIALIGPTATGKSSLGVKIAQRLGGEIVNCDSVQMYRHLEIGTGKPPLEQRRLVPHHLYDILDLNEHYSAGRYMVEGRRICQQIVARRTIPIVVGGSGLYLKALLEGIFVAPARCQELRDRLEQISNRKGLAFLHRLLKSKDPAAARRIHPGDRIRIVRALEVYFLTGTPISHLQGLNRSERYPQQFLQGFRILKLGLNLSRPVLHDRIHRRIDDMFHCGLVEEVRRLLDRGYSPQAKGFEALGYRYIIAFLSGEMSLEEVRELTQRDSRRYAKRQMTWFRKEKNVHWIELTGEDPQALEQALAQIIHKVS